MLGRSKVYRRGTRKFRNMFYFLLSFVTLAFVQIPLRKGMTPSLPRHTYGLNSWEDWTLHVWVTNIQGERKL